MATIKTTATILSGASLSDVIMAPNGYFLAALLIPAVWTAAGVTFQASDGAGGTFGNVFSTAGEVTFATDAVGRFLTCSPNEFRSVQTFKVRSGTAGTPVNQGADRLITLLYKPID